jgi:hypothetical protein
MGKNGILQTPFSPTLEGRPMVIDLVGMSVEDD